MATSPGSRPLRVMVDTTVLLAGMIWPRFPHEVLQHALRGDLTLVLCPYVLAQARRKFQERFSDFAQDFEDFLTLVPYEEAPDPTASQVAAQQHLVRDITDVPVALAALNAQVDYLVSDDKDLTALNQPVHQQLRVLLSGTFLNAVMGWTHEELEAVRRRQWPDLPDE